MKKIKKDLLEKFLQEFIKESDLNEQEDIILFDALKIIKMELVDEEVKV